jgi:hypothetical protein
MKLRILAFTVACVAIVTSADAEGIWFGPQIAWPLPGSDVGDNQLGMDAGVTIYSMKKSSIGIGADVIWHYWPASPGYKADIDRYLSQTRYQVIDGSSWAFSALQMTGHVRLAVPMMVRHEAWMKVGAGVYRVNHHLEPPNWEGSPVRVINLSTDEIVWVPGGYGTIGIDVRTSSSTVFGVDASYHHLTRQSEPALLGGRAKLPSFSTFTMGLHVLFGT